MKNNKSIAKAFINTVIGMAAGIIAFKQVFKGCTSLEDIDLSELDFSSATNLTNMFQMCTSLTDIDLSSVDFSNVTDMSGMFAGCKSLESLDLSGHTWVSGGPRMDQIISSCPNLTEIIIDKNIQVSSATSFLGAENDYVKTKVIGQMSDSFKKNAMSKLLIGNRYIAAADVKASINLVRDEAYDSWYYGLKLPNSRIVKVQQNHGSDTIEFGHEDYEIYFGEPGDYTITLTQGNKEYDRRTGTYTVVPVNETEDGVFKCNVNPLTKTIRVTRSDDGSVRIQEI